MKAGGHLLLHRELLAPSEERELSSCGWLFVQPERGWAYWLWERTAVELNPGDMLILFPQNCGCLRASQIGEVEFHSFYFCPNLLAGLLTLAERQQVQEFAATRNPPPRVLPASHPRAQQFAGIARGTSPTGTLLDRCKLLELTAAALTGEILQAPVHPERPHSAGDRFRLLAAQMTDSEWSQYTAEEAARVCGCSVRHFRQLFRQHFGAVLRISRRDGRMVVALGSECGGPACLQKSNNPAMLPSPAPLNVLPSKTNVTTKKHD